MTPAKRIILNTMVQYARTFVSMLLMLYVSRLLLRSLGQSGYGIYAVIGSSIFMIGFITQSLAISTQRFLSFHQGKNDANLQNGIFANALYLHIAIAFIIGIVMWCAEPLFMNYLNIPEERCDASRFMYYMVLMMTIITFIASPVRALFIAHENIVYVAIVEVIDSVLKLAGALMIPFVAYDSLKFYSVIMVTISVFNLFAYFIYALVKYNECHLPNINEISKQHMRQLLGFSAWNIYSVGAGIIRNQGIALIINKIGIIVNAAYGIAQQVINAVSFIAMSILNAINPQIMKAEGAGDRNKMLYLCTKESKYSLLVLSILLFPFIIEMPEILDFWLDDVPPYSVMFSRYLIIALIMDQITIGLDTANQAIGKIRNYSLLISTTRLLEVIAGYISIKMGGLPVWTMWWYIIIEIIIAVMRFIYMRMTAGLQIRSYIEDVCVKNILPIIGVIATSYIVTSLIDIKYRFIITEIAGVLMGSVLAYMFALSAEEKNWLNYQIRSCYEKLSRHN